MLNGMIEIDNLATVRAQLGDDIPNPSRAVGHHTRKRGCEEARLEDECPDGAAEGRHLTEHGRIAQVGDMHPARLFVVRLLTRASRFDRADTGNLHFLPALAPNVYHAAIHTHALGLSGFNTARRRGRLHLGSGLTRLLGLEQALTMPLGRSP